MAATSTTDRTTAGSRSLRLRSFAAVVGLLASAIALAAEPSRSERAADGPSLSPPVLDFGAVGHGTERTLEFTLRGGDAPTSWTRPRPSCSCTTVEFDHSTPVAAGGLRRGRVTVAFGRGRRSFSKRVEFPRADGGPPLVLGLRASYLPGVSIEPRAVDLEGTTKSELPRAKQVVRVGLPPRADRAPSTSSRPKSDSPRLAVVGIRGRDASCFRAAIRSDSPANHGVEISFVPPGRPFTTHVATLDLIADGLPIQIPLRAFEQGSFGIDRPTITFPRATSWDDLETVVHFELYDTKGFRIESVEHVPSAGSVVTLEHRDPRPARPGVRAPKITLGAAEDAKTQPLPHGRIGGVIRVETSHPDHPVVEIPVVGFLAGEE